ncbi:MAG: branched-chain amino acid ABC transporter permease [Candidatus Competibacterales bacterium]|nr:branched-chain amino acid ABC transporter permease [Candidatus Competibacterales bacterium]
MAERPPRRRTWVVGLGLAALALLPVYAAATDDPYLLSLGSRMLIYALAAVSLDLLIGYAGQISLGHAAFFGIGAYVAGIATYHDQYGDRFLGLVAGSNEALLLWPLALAVTALVALPFGLLSLRTGGAYFIMLTLALAQMLFFLFTSLSAYGGADGISLWQRNRLPELDTGNDRVFYYLCLGLLVGFVGLCRRLVDSRLGMVIRGCKQNERRLRALGVSTLPYKLAWFVLAGAGAGLAGALLCNQSGYVSPSLLHWTQSGELMVMVLLGGLGTLYGPVLGAVTLLLLEETLTRFTEHWQLLLGPLLLAVVLFARRGLFGLLAGPDARDG